MGNGIRKISHVYDTNPVSSWDELMEVSEKHKLSNVDNAWLFRGQECADWEIKSTFERAKPEVTRKDPWKYEAAILREFTRRAHHYVGDLPKSNNVLEWFSLMRHFGAPSRLVDFTYSFFVSIYFAVKKVDQKNGIAGVWAIRQSWLRAKYKKLFPHEKEERLNSKNPEEFYNYFLNSENSQDFVAAVNPFRMNEKLTAQQGVFLCPGNISKPFMQNLFSGYDNTDNNESNLIRILLTGQMKEEAIKHLWRMNINSATLFPDLAGFTEYLSDWFYLPLDFKDKDLHDAIKGVFPGNEAPLVNDWKPGSY